jgi:hypothetical protein
MYDHLRSCFAAFLLAGLSISPASSNPLADLFSASSRETPAPAPAPAQEECLRQPGKLAADGQRWVYHSDGHRKCWFQTAVGAFIRPVQHYVVKQHVASRERREAALPKRKADVDARAEVLRSSLDEMSQPTPSAPKLKVAQAAPAQAAEAAAIDPPAPVAESATDQLTPDRPTLRLVDVETLRVSPTANVTLDSSVLPEIPIAFRLAEAGDDGRGWTMTLLGVLLMALGLVSLMSASLPALVGLFSRTEQRRSAPKPDHSPLHL